MRKFLLLGAAALMVPSVAFADGEEMAAPTGWFGGVQAGWTQMNMPEHQNGYASFGAAQVPPTAQADVDGVNYAFGIGKDLDSGWRVLAYADFFDGDGSSTQTVGIPVGTLIRRGSILGTTSISAPLVVALNGKQTLDVDVTEYQAAVSVGHALIDMVRGDLVASYGENDTEYNNLFDVSLVPSGPPTVTEQGTTRTTFNSSTYELAARLSAAMPLSDSFSFGIGGSAGYGFRNIGMRASQKWVQGGALFASSSLGIDGVSADGFIGRADASLNYAIARSTTIGLTANYVYDENVPVYVAPVYPAAGTGSAATFVTESQSSMTFGLRVVGRF
jgi:hypothetical protein